MHLRGGAVAYMLLLLHVNASQAADITGLSTYGTLIKNKGSTPHPNRNVASSSSSSSFTLSKSSALPTDKDKVWWWEQPLEKITSVIPSTPAHPKTIIDYVHAVVTPFLTLGEKHPHCVATILGKYHHVVCTPATSGRIGSVLENVEMAYRTLEANYHPEWMHMGSDKVNGRYVEGVFETDATSWNIEIGNACGKARFTVDRWIQNTDLKLDAEGFVSDRNLWEIPQPVSTSVVVSSRYRDGSLASTTLQPSRGGHRRSLSFPGAPPEPIPQRLKPNVPWCIVIPVMNLDRRSRVLAEKKRRNEDKTRGVRFE